MMRIPELDRRICLALAAHETAMRVIDRWLANRVRTALLAELVRLLDAVGMPEGPIRRKCLEIYSVARLEELFGYVAQWREQLAQRAAQERAA